MVGWETKSIGEIAQVKGGKRVPKGYKLETAPTAHTYITVSDFSDDGSIDTTKLRFISDEVYERIKRYTISHKDLYISIAGTIGKTGYVPEGLDGANLTENACKLVFNPSIDKVFVYYFTKTTNFIDQAGINTRVAAQPKLALERLKTISLKVPPLPEQKRIVAILDEAFAGIDAAVANTRQNLANACELFESYLNAVFTRKGEGWVEKKLGDFSVSISTGPFGSLLHKSDYVSEGVPLVNPINIVGSDIVPNNSKLIDTETKKRLQSYVLHQGDIVIARRGEIGRCAVIDIEHDGWVCGTGCFFMRPLSSVNPHFLAHLIRSQGYREKLEQAATGSTMKNLSNKTLSSLLVAIPSFESQAEILAKFDELAGDTQRLESIYQQKLAALAELKQSILQKAFAGELTTLPETTLEEAVA